MEEQLVFDSGAQTNAGVAYYGELAEKSLYMGNTLKARLDRAVEEAEGKLKDATRAREIFSKHPELEELINIMQKGRF